MNGRGHVSRYRPRQRRNKILPLIVFISIIVLALLALFIVLGNYFNDRSQNQPPAVTPSESEREAPKAAPPSVRCYVLDIEGEAASQTNNNLSKLASSGARAVSVNVRGSDSTLLYSSNVAKSFGKQSGGYIEMSTIASRADSRAMYLSAYLRLEFMSEKNSDVRAAKLGYEAALVSEMCSAGADDVVVYAPDAAADNYTELVRLAENVKAANPAANIGVALKKDIFLLPNSALIIDELYKVYDILCIDLTEIKINDIEEALESAVGSNLYYILRYNTRVILPDISDAELLKKVNDSLSANSVSNIQFVKIKQN